MSRPKLRKVNTQRRKQERREAERNLKRRANMLLDIDENCCVCRAPFDKKNKEMATTWHVVVYEAKEVAGERNKCKLKSHCHMMTYY